MLSQTVMIEETNGPETVTWEGLTFPVSFLLSEWVKRLGGYSGELPDNEDPTFVYLHCRWRNGDRGTLVELG